MKNNIGKHPPVLNTSVKRTGMWRKIEYTIYFFSFLLLFLVISLRLLKEYCWRPCIDAIMQKSKRKTRRRKNIKQHQIKRQSNARKGKCESTESKKKKKIKINFRVHNYEHKSRVFVDWLVLWHFFFCIFLCVPSSSSFPFL